MKRVLVLLLVVVFFAPVGPAASRTWKSISGRFSTEADLLGLKDGKVQLKKTDGTVIDVPLERLSDADQQYVKERYSEPPPPAIRATTRKRSHRRTSRRSWRQTETTRFRTLR